MSSCASCGAVRKGVHRSPFSARAWLFPKVQWIGYNCRALARLDKNASRQCRVRTNS
jgi:hypothetical protein